MASKTLRPTAARRKTLMLAVGALILFAIVALPYWEWAQYRRTSISAKSAESNRIGSDLDRESAAQRALFVAMGGSLIFLVLLVAGSVSINKAMLAREEALQALRETEKRYHLAVEAALSGIVVVNKEGEIVLVNSRTEELFGYKREELVGKRVEVLVPERFRAAHQGFREDFQGRPQTRAMGAGRELFGLKKDGGEFPIEIGLNPIQTNEEALVLSSIVDITQRKQMEEQRLELMTKERALDAERALREAQTELARVLRVLSLGEMATSVAHEINQPLASVVLNAEAGLHCLTRDVPNIQEATESFALIAQDANRASTVIRRIREFLRKGEQEASSLNINEVVQETVALARAELEKRQIAIQTELNSGLPRVRGHRIELQQVIFNLITNGADAMASAQGDRELLVTSQKSRDGGVVVAVRDSGLGISPQDLPRMFEAFFTTKPTGMGMGLSISRTIIEAHGGRIWAELNDGPGLIVQFELPAESPQAARSLS